jgi:Cysteine-rich secretory protein family
MFLLVKTLTAMQLLFGTAYIKPGYYSVIRFGNTMEEKKPARSISNEDISNKEKRDRKYPTFWGGDVLFWGNNDSYGYTATGLGQEIYKDDNTKLMEKLVVPWLMYYTNLYRKEHGLDTLQYDQCLLKSAGYQTDYLFNESRKNHQFKLGHTQDTSSRWFKGKSPSERALAAGCEKYCGENALYSNIPPLMAGDFNNRKKLNLAAQKIARDMVYIQWHNSKGHRENMLTNGYRCLGVSVAVGKHYSDDSYISDSGEKTMIKDTNTISWIAFGVQVMSY